MARNKTLKPLTEAPPEPESSSEHMSGSSTDPEQEVSSAASSSTEEDEEEQTPTVQTTPPPPSLSSPLKKSTTAKKPTPQPEPESSSGESESDEEEEEEEEPPVAKLKPTSKPVNEPPSSSKPRSKPTEKRPVENEKEKEKPPSKRVKKDNDKIPVAIPISGLSPGPSEEGSKKLFQRVFSEEDEVAILKAMIEFKDRTGRDPMKNDDEFYGFVKKKLHAEVNKSQVVDKVKRLRRKFNNAKKSKKKIANDHDKQLFELSNRIWEVNEDEGDANGGGFATPMKGVKENDNVSGGGKLGMKDQGLKSDNGGVEEKKKRKEEENEGFKIDEGSKIGEVEVKEVMRVEALKLMGEEGRAEINEMWRKVEIAQMEVDLMRNEARVKESRMIMKALGLKR